MLDVGGSFLYQGVIRLNMHNALPVITPLLFELTAHNKLDECTCRYSGTLG